MSNLLGRAVANLLRRPIPRIIHQVWTDGAPPAEYTKLQRSWRAFHPWPRWQHVLWDFDAGFAMLSRYYPKLCDVWVGLPKAVQRADLLRYAVLHKYGGVYADMDTEALKSFGGLCRDYDFFAAYETKPYPSLCNAIIGSRPGHPVLGAMLRFAEDLWDESPTDPTEVSHVFATTGSLALTPVAMSARTDRTGLLPTGTFYPFSWAEKHRCHGHYPDAYAKHYWASGWYDEKKYRLDAYWEAPVPDLDARIIARCLDGERRAGA